MSAHTASGGKNAPIRGDDASHAGGPSLPHHLEAVDAAPYLDALAGRFGIDPEILSRHYRFFRSGGRNLSAVGRALAVPPEVRIRFTGIRILRTSMATPKPTSEAVPLLGSLATRNTIALDAEEIDAVRRHEDILADANRIRDYRGPGFVIAFFRGIPVALVSARPASEDGDPSVHRVLLRSWYPERRLGTVET